MACLPTLRRLKGILLALALASCRRAEAPPAVAGGGETGPPIGASVDVQPPTDSLQLGPDGLGAIRLCAPLATVESIYHNATYLLSSSEGESWPSRVVPLAPGESLLVFSSWADTLHIWGISTTSPRHHTRRGYRVGTTVGELRARGDSVEVGFGEGTPVVTLQSEDVSAEVDSAGARILIAADAAQKDLLAALPDAVHLTALWIGKDCRRRPPN